jgi:hypothetical protein
VRIIVGRYGRCSEECGRALGFVHVLQSQSPPSSRAQPRKYVLTLCLGGETAGGLRNSRCSKQAPCNAKLSVNELFNGHRNSCRLHGYLTMISEATSCVDIHFGYYNSTAGLSYQGSPLAPIEFPSNLMFGARY